jgi:hypothetical protein
VSPGQIAFAWASVANWPAPEGDPVEGPLSVVLGLEVLGAGAGAGAAVVVVGAGAGAAVVVVGAGAGAAVVAVGAGAAAGVGAVPARQAATYALSVMPLAWKPALSARHSSVQALAVFAPGAAVVGAGAGAAVVVVGAGAAAGVGAVPARQAATYALSVMPLAWKPALSARHSSVQALAVFAPGVAVVVGVGAGAAAGVASVPARQAATYALSVMPLAWKPALSARHSSVQALAVFP